ncbi:MAG TPA: hypothetical protein VIH92_08185 [Solirubrobacteraceae bacterium]
MSADRLRYGFARMARWRVIIGSLHLAALLSALLAGTAWAGTSSTLSKESSNPINDQGSSYDYRSNITGVSPSVPGLSVEVLEFADRLLLRNHTGKTVTIYGYEGEPYARVLANGTAEQNVRAPATYLNTNFYAQVTVPAIASSSAPPKWEVVDRTGEFEWHDHRIHWMSPVPPASVKNKTTRTLIFGWKVPIEVGSSKGAISGQLFWTPESSKAPLAIIILGIVIVLAGLAFVVYVRRRRAGQAIRGPGAGAEDVDGAPSEAW